MPVASASAITQPAYGLWSRRYGSFAGKAATLVPDVILMGDVTMAHGTISAVAMAHGSLSTVTVDDGSIGSITIVGH